MNEIPCLPNIHQPSSSLNLNELNGAKCWNIGWGSEENDGSYSRRMKSIGLNLMSQKYCTAHSFWEVEDGYMCSGLPPNDSTPFTTNGWKHVTAGGKGTCIGDYGAPLICDIDGTATLIGVHSKGDLTECGLPGKPGINTFIDENVQEWIGHIIVQPRTECFEFFVDMEIDGALGDQIEIYLNDATEPLINPALKSQQSRPARPLCISNTKQGDRFTFKIKGTDNVSKHVQQLLIDLIPKILKPFRFVQIF